MIIADLGINHNGDVQLAKKMIDAAVDAGCNLVKFQKRTVDKVFSHEYLNSLFESPWGSTQRQFREHVEFGLSEYQELDAYCKQKGIEWFASAWDVDSQLFLRQFNLQYNKVASPMLTNVPLLETIAEEDKYTFISTAFASWPEVDTALALLSGVPYTLLHSASVRPIKESQANLRTLEVMRERFSCSVGYSGLEKSHFVSVLAHTMGAEVIQRRITLDNAMFGPHQASSVQPKELCDFVDIIRRATRIIGDGSRVITPENIQMRSLVASGEM